MRKVIVGITGNEKEMPALSGITYVAVARDLAEGVKEAGGLPIVIPIGQPELAKDYVAMIDKLVLSGGQHVDPRFYGEEKEIDSDDYLLERDEFELVLIRESLETGEPHFCGLPWHAAIECCLGWNFATIHRKPLARRGRRDLAFVEDSSS